MAGTSWIAVDWGTSTLRAWHMSGRRVRDEAVSAAGMATLAPEGFEAALLSLIAPWLEAGLAARPDAPIQVIACGMVGARQGWTEAPYVPVPCPATAEALTPAPCRDARLSVWIAPGVRQADPPDVMRGEETQIAGFLARHPQFDGVLCLPGTHTKWAHISAGEIVSFRSFMTGELFALLSQHSVLRHSVDEAWDDAAFDAGLDVTRSRPERLAAELFSIRAAGLLEAPAPGAARARLSGLLIGAEIAATKPYWLGQEVGIIGAARIAAPYQRALSAQGVSATIHAADALVLAGLTTLYEKGGA